MTFLKTTELMCSVYSKARDVGYDDLEFGLPKITTLFTLGRHGLGEREKRTTSLMFLFCFLLAFPLFLPKHGYRLREGIYLLQHWHLLIFPTQ